MKQSLRKHTSSAILAVSVIVLGALGVAGGSKTIEMLKVWFRSLVEKSS